MLERAKNLSLSAGPAISILVGVGTILGTLGASQTVWVAIAIVGFAIGLVVALWFVDRGVRGRYIDQIRERPVLESSRAQELQAQSTPDEPAAAIREQVVPAFSGIGVDRTHQVFLKLIPELDLTEDEKQELTEFVERTASDGSLDEQQRIEQIVFRFAPSSPRGSGHRGS